MAVTFEILTLTSIIIIGIQLDTIHGLPEITPNDNEYVIKSSEDFSLNCKSEVPITWSYPQIESQSEAVENPKILNVESKYSREGDLYVANLEITNATELNVGYYYCNETYHPENFAALYLYVEDDQALAAGWKEIIVVNGKQFQPLIIPCRPTSPTVDVKLYAGVGSDPGTELTNSSKLWTFDKKVGYKLRITTSSIHATYSCKFILGDVSIEMVAIVRVNKVFDVIRQPIIHQLEDTIYNTEYETLNLKCTVEVDESQTASFKWRFNGIEIKDDGEKYSIYTNTTSSSVIAPFTILTVYNITRHQDEGNYSCHVTDDENTNENFIKISILPQGTNFLYLSESNNISSTHCANKCKEIVFNINVVAYPKANNSWYHNNLDKPLVNSQKYAITNTIKESVLVISNVTIRDRGYYTIKSTNEYHSKKLPVFLNVTDKPSIEIKKDEFHVAGETETVTCKVWAYPKPEIKWEFRPCTDNSCEFRPINSSKVTGNTEYTSTAQVSATQSGYLKCSASNVEGTDEKIVDYTVTDVKEGFRVVVIEDQVVLPNKDLRRIRLAVGDEVTFECIASAQNYSSDIKWYFNKKPVEEYDAFTPETSKTKFSTKRYFTITNLGREHEGVYKCATQRLSKNVINASEINVEVVEPQAPRIRMTNINKSQEEYVYPNEYNFTCLVDGVPRPDIIWLKDSVEFYPDNDRIQYRNNKQTLLFTSTQPSDKGQYSCLVKNRISSLELTGTMTFANSNSDYYIYIYITIPILVVVLLGIAIALLVKIRNERKLEKILQQAGLANFEKGAIESINPDLGIDDQAELLPYDKESWEIPKDTIKLGKQLGAGAFGVVMKAVIERYIDNETDLTVAVKMVKKTADDSYLRALVSELKIMVHLGKHLNVVNLIGACTKHIAKRELYVIVEFCRFGNLHNYLLRHRGNFINQIDVATGKIDYSIGVDILSRSFSVSSSHSQEGPPKDMMDYRSNYNGVVQTTEVTLVSMSPSGSQGDEPLMSNNSVQPEWRSNYKGDYKGNVKPICTKDLLTWAFQISRGMEYLASRKVLHGDLAARNILLADNNIVKICDFGLAKSMYKSDNYKKKGDGPLPIKWMSIESIRDRVFSTQSDVWSFGIVLWEFFSLARTPYPGMDADERLFQKLVEGYRMDQPCYATKEIYTMMLNCWEPKPLSRPSFGRLSERIGSMLEESVKKHYIDLNDPYLVMNTERFQNGQNDYLQMVSPPDFEKLSSPHYVNDLPHTPNTAQSDYMPMKPAHIFSPREPLGEVFTFSELNEKELRSPEAAPMLRSDSDYDTLPSTPKSPNELPSYANPMYNKLDFLKEKNIIVNTPDNYVNMPKNKSAMKGETDSFGKDDVHYVNNVSRDWEKVQ
ncbi:Protein tyrosine and serine/threonine kinase [Popillia japonica]|uniref:Protein tyrosine and serine/threonine kinase n=1 Tax=Popillia japonica TaxID=7064 RepID=A0AAW1HVF3_POPJA